MKKPGLILLLGLLVAVVAFAGFYLVGTAASRDLMREPQPELAWLKKEFKLSDAEFARISALHEAYLPQCAERCRRIEEQNAKLQALLAAAGAVTPEVEQAIAQRARMRADCEAEMLKHFLEVSRTMPPAQGQRYLAWVEQQTFLQGSAMEQRHRTEGSSHQHQH
ncbi:MAG TPA: periplasmic heavy metal sensor [Clostridia bacterium]|nr:periplasmic heavy metal sensor [Clostridia bacterium]